MEPYVLDSNFDRLDFVENYSSFIWTERYANQGDYKITTPPTERAIRTFHLGRYIALPDSSRLMRIQNVRQQNDQDGKSVIACSGNSFESFFKERVVIHNDTDGWRNTGRVAALATSLVARICIDGTERSPADIIPGLRYSQWDPDSATHSVQLRDRNLYQAVKELCDLDDFGFRVTFDESNKGLVFKAYRGVDRTGTNPVVFSPQFENLANLRYLMSNEEFKNVAYVSHNDRQSVFIAHRLGHENASGLNRHVLTVDANDIDNPTDSELRDRGREELRKHNRINLFEGEATLATTFRYGRDYDLGDLVRIDNGRGSFSTARVVEYVRTYDQDGLRSYPTFEAID